MAWFKLNLRGTEFQSASQSLKSFLESKQVSCNDILHQGNGYIVDRNPIMFHSVLDYYARGQLHIPSYVCPVQALEELEFWGIDVTAIPPCCYKHMHDDDLDNYEAIAALDKTTSNLSSVDPEKEKNNEQKTQSPRERLLKIYENPFDSIFGKLWMGFVILNIVASIIVFGLRTCEATRKLNNNVILANITVASPNMRMLMTTRSYLSVKIIDLLTNGILILDIFIRFMISRCKVRFILDIGNILELLSFCMAFYTHHADENPELSDTYAKRKLLVIAGVLYSMRVIGILRVARYSKQVRILRLTLFKSCHELFLYAVITLTFSVIFGSFMYWSEFESSYNTYTDLFIAIWWALITMTTVGYGDFYPKTAFGYIVGGVTAMSGIALLALPMAILANKFHSYYTCSSYKTKHNELLSRKNKDKITF